MSKNYKVGEGVTSKHTRNNGIICKHPCPNQNVHANLYYVKFTNNDGTEYYEFCEESEFDQIKNSKARLYKINVCISSIVFDEIPTNKKLLKEFLVDLVGNDDFLNNVGVSLILDKTEITEITSKKQLTKDENYWPLGSEMYNEEELDSFALLDILYPEVKPKKDATSKCPPKKKPKPKPKK